MMRRAVFVLTLAAVLLHPARVYPDQAPHREASRHAGVERVLVMEATAYTSSVEDCGKADGITATGTIAGPGTISADWNILPPGTVLEIPGYGRGIVADRGGAIRGNRLDLWVPSRKAARQWGRRTVMVRVIKEAGTQI